MSGETVIWVVGLFCIALYIFALTLPSDKPKHRSDCK
jgi:hypothetical protein